MPELVTPEGKPVNGVAGQVDREFSRAMAADPDPAAAAAAPPRRPDPPDSTSGAKRGPGRPPGSRNKPRVDSGAARGKTAAAAAAPAAALTDDDRADGIRGLVQLGAGLCLIVDRTQAKTDPRTGKRTDSQAYKADALTLANSADDLAAAAVATARADARFAAALDRVMAVGPYGALISAAIGVGTQIMRNHRPDAKIPGTVDPADMIHAAEALPVPA